MGTEKILVAVSVEKQVRSLLLKSGFAFYVRSESDMGRWGPLGSALSSQSRPGVCFDGYCICLSVTGKHHIICCHLFWDRVTTNMKAFLKLLVNTIACPLCNHVIYV